MLYAIIYYPFGMIIPGRNYALISQRFGFNGKEYDDEIKLKGNILNYDARFYDTRLGNFLSLDPAEKKYAFQSGYVAFGDNPIYFKDNQGKTLEPGGNTTVALNDIRSLVPKDYQAQIKINSAGKIEFDSYEKLPDAIKHYEGVKLVNDLINSENDYKYSVGSINRGTQRSTGDKFLLKMPSGNTIAQRAIGNLSITPRSDYDLDDQANFLPEDGYEGTVTLSDGKFFRKNPMTGTGKFEYDRSKIVFHELLENYLRTEEKKDYPGLDGAHEGASDKANKFSKETTGKNDPYGGYATDFEESKSDPKDPK